MNQFIRLDRLENWSLVSINHESIESLQSECFRVLRWDKDVNAVEVFDCQRGCFVALQGVGSQWHRHPEVEITLIRSGSGIRVVGDKSSLIPTSESLVILGRGLPHYWKFKDTSSGICVQFNDLRLLRLLAEQPRIEVRGFINRASFGLEFGAKVRGDAVELMRELSAVSKGRSRLGNFGLFLQLIGQLSNTDPNSARQISSIRFDGAFNEDKYCEMQKAVDWIMSNYQSEIRLADVLDLVQMSKTSFSRHFAKFTGLSFSKFVNATRISNACLLLHSTERSITEIAAESGFSNLSNFNRLFRQSKRISPSQYKIEQVLACRR